MVSLEMTSFPALGVMTQQNELVWMTAFGNEFHFFI